MTMVNKIITIILIVLVNSVFGQTSYKNKKWTLENVELKDFNLIGKAIGDSRIVMLGEQDHGDGETFKKKIDVVKYLIETKGFNVIAFESDFFAINKISEANLSAEEKVELVTDQLHGIWRKSNEFLPLMDYISQSIQIGHEITLAGFDSQHHSNYTKTNYVDCFKTMLVNNEIVIDETFFEVLAMFVKEGFKYRPQDTEVELFNSTLEMIETKLASFVKTSGNEFWLQELRSLKGDFKEVCQEQGKGLGILNKRDLQMADNLEYLVRIKFTDKKIIVWAANYHIAKNPEKVSWSKKWDPQKDSLITMGDIVDQTLTNEIYSIAFICGQGFYTNWVENNEPIPILATLRPKNSLEKALYESNCIDCFIDFHSTLISEPFYMAGHGHYPRMGQWDKVFDGVFFIKEMTPSTYKKSN